MTASARPGRLAVECRLSTAVPEGPHSTAVGLSHKTTEDRECRDKILVAFSNRSPHTGVQSRKRRRSTAILHCRPMKLPETVPQFREWRSTRWLTQIRKTSARFF